MADGLFGGAYTGNPNIQRQGARARALAQQRDVNTLPDPRTYAAVSGLFGTAPDEMGFSVLNPQYQDIMRVAEPAFAAGTALGVAPMVGLGARMTKGLPVGASIKNVGSKLKIKPSTDDVYEVMDASFDYGKFRGNKNIAIEKLFGGVRMSDPQEAKRVKDLAEKISGTDGYISRIIVDDMGNVIEGQHRLEALRLLGKKDVPVAVIEDLSNKYNIPAMTKMLEGKLRSDNVNQMVKRAIDALEEAGSVDKALSDYVMPAQFQKLFQDALRASVKPSPYPQQAALDLAQQRAALPVEQGGLGLLGSNTAEQRAKAMGFVGDFAHGSPESNITKLQPSKTGAEGPGIYATSYFPESATYAGREPGATAYPLKVKTDTAYQSGGENPYMKLIVNDDDQLLNALQRRGKESIIKEQQPTPEWLRAIGAMETPIRDHFVSMNSDLFRSRFAAFDPFRRSAAIAATMGAAAPDLLASPMYTDPFPNTIADTTR